MRNLARFSLLLLLIGGTAGTGCAPGDTNGTALEDGDDGGSSGNAGSSGFGNTAGIAGMVPISTVNCGDGTKNEGEYCDDHNLVGGDGCSPSCQVEAGWECPTPGAPCVRQSMCGDGILGPSEQCDDMNTMAGDGCAADCKMVEPGFVCRVPGKRCAPFCGDGQQVGTENCDDMNTMNGDGCSATCLVEPGSSCMGTPSMCTMAVCGNGMMEAGESCDDGTNIMTANMTATGRINGLFTGDPMEAGRGCSKTCTKEPACRDATTTRACDSVCGDANKEMSEACDDGNAVNGDGCSSTCTIEAGFTCMDEARPDTEQCVGSANTNCLRMPVTFRDFDGQQLATGHPDFFFLGSTPAGQSKVICVPNASGRTVGMNGSCWDSDSTPMCTGIAAASLGPNGKPALGATTSCPCRFTDWDNTGVLAGATVPTTTCSSGAANPTRVETMTRVVQSADSFAQWYTNSDKGTRVLDFIELGQLAGGMQYQFSSSNGRTVYTDLHDIFMNAAIPATNGAPANSLSSGFFPLEGLTGAHSTKLCNLWPYWPAALTTANCLAQSGNPVWQQWDPQGSGQRGVVGTGGPLAPVTGVARNFYFTSEVRYLFRYAGGESLAFYGDDDVWVFINGKLVLDLGAPHERLRGTVTLGATGAAWTVQTTNIITNTDSTIGMGTVTNLGLEAGRTYEIAVFHADRHLRESNYQLTLSGFATQRSTCAPFCGDGVVAAAEECDDGPMNMDGVYGACTTMCRFGPFCGDGVPDVGNEECDQGRANGAGYGQANGCTGGCRFPPRCGDGIVNGEYGEACDAGSANSPTGECRPDCTLPDR